MTEVLAVFRSRSQAMDCNAKLKSLGVTANLVNTPREANVGCGLSVKIPKGNIDKVRYLVRKVGYSAFYGFLGIYTNYGRTYYGRIS